MSATLKDSSEYYDLPSQNGVYPISKIDVAIITKLIYLLGNSEPKIVEILKEWKIKPDDNIRVALSELGDDREMSGEDVKKAVIDFIEINNEHILQVKTLVGISRIDSYDSRLKKTIYKVIVNKTESTDVRNANIEIKFEDEVDREIFLEDLKTRLSSYTNIRFL